MIKVISAVLTLVFLSFAFVQLNDPDPMLWTTFYLAIAVISFLRVLNKQHKKIVLVVMVITILIAGYSVPGFVEWLLHPNKSEIFGEMVYQKSYIEETREFLGSLIGLSSLIFQYFKA